MSNTVIPVEKRDHTRVVLTETLPFELPIIFSNEGFYLWLRHHLRKAVPAPGAEARLVELGKKLIVDRDKSLLLEPLKYSVEQGPYRTRELALLHPRSQYAWAEFYAEFAGLIVYYCNRSSFSVRAPIREAGHVFASSPDTDELEKEDRLAQTHIDVRDEDRVLRHPGSFFAYRGYRRLHQFFDSEEFLDLERKFPVLWQLDVVNCFGSIYTHSLGWAVKSKRFAKENLHANETFASKFDRCMQNSNWRETNGIPVGPEVSRLFAEVILQAVDIRLKRSVTSIRQGTDYEVRRYVDDYFVFGRSTEVAAQVATSLTAELDEFGLRLNSAKTIHQRRPFISPQSAALSQVRLALEKLRSSLFVERPVDASTEETGGAHKKQGVRLYPGDSPTHVLRRRKLDFIREVKVACMGVPGGYESVALYVLAALERYVTTMWRTGIADSASEPNYRSVLAVMIDVTFFFLRVHTSVEASFRVASICLRALRFLKKANLESAATEVEQTIFEECTEFLSEPLPSDKVSAPGAGVDRLNIVSVLSQLRHHSVPWKTLRNWVLPNELAELGYFQAIVSLHCGHAKGDQQAIQDVASAVVDRIESAKPVQLKCQSQLLHLALDTASCPFLEKKLRRRILRALCKAAGMQSPVDADADPMLDLADQRPWFTNWGDVHLVRSLERKKATRVY